MSLDIYIEQLQKDFEKIENSKTLSDSEKIEAYNNLSKVILELLESNNAKGIKDAQLAKLNKLFLR